MKILLAEDDPVFQLLLTKTLSRWGYEPLVTTDGKEASRLLRSPDGPRIAILDWVMPFSDGLEVCRQVRGANLTHYVYLILLTSRTDSNDVVAGFEAGADDYLAKPVSLNELKLRLRTGCRMLESEDRHRVVAESASEGIMMIDQEERICFANAAAGLVFDYAAAELVGMDLTGLGEEFHQTFRTTRKGPTSCDVSHNLRSWLPVEVTARSRNGREMQLEVSFSESRDDYQHHAVTAVIRDVTARKAREQQLAQAQKLESIGQLAAGIAHEINTPIQYIGDNGHFLQAAFGDMLGFMDDQVRSNGRNRPSGGGVAVAPSIDFEYLRQEIPRAIEQLLEGVDHVAQIVRAMKEFSHFGPVAKMPAQINRIIDSTILVSRSEWKYLADVTTDFDPELPTVPCLVGEFNQVMLNLIVNSAQAIGERVGSAGEKGSIHISTRRKGNWAEIRVRDTGGGIPEDVQPKVFNPFFTTKDVGKGTGQGLAIAHTVIVQRHQGNIKFETEAGVGTTFIIELPLD